MAEMRLQRFLAQAGVAARRKAELLITDGRVKVNGKVVTALGSKVDPDVDRVEVDGQPVHQEELRYILFNKPKGCITAVSDPEGRRTVMEFMPGLPASVVPVGRLDFYSEGVLLLTNDGALNAALLSSKNHVEKSYHIKLKGTIEDRDVQKLRNGVRLDYRTTTKPAQVDRLKGKSKHDWLIVTITEGKNRQLHRMLEAVGHEITKLQRVSFGGIGFHGLRVGDARELTQNEVKELYQAAGLTSPKGVLSRGTWKVKRESTEKARRMADRTREQVTPNLTPGGSKKARAKLLQRYRDAEEAGLEQQDLGAASGARKSEGRGRAPSAGRGNKPAAGRGKKPAPGRASPKGRGPKPAGKGRSSNATSQSRRSKPGGAKPGGAKPGGAKPGGKGKSTPTSRPSRTRRSAAPKGRGGGKR